MSQTSSESTVPTAQKTTPHPPSKYRGDRGNVYKRDVLIAGRTPKEMGLRKTKKSVDLWVATCGHENKRGKPDCGKKFSGFNAKLVMGNKALHEKWHLDQDAKQAEWSN